MNTKRSQLVTKGYLPKFLNQKDKLNATLAALTAAESKLADALNLVTYEH